ncbi:carbohydrate ABC transporter permease [Paenibacillus segetis]|uniref:ABC transporter permease n=1 Tax=Paenibacillus segetis TaxID=1325360 RepID=A0ABQ1YSB6_9BACL|nr:sugar ABC transporter permease [Paenibacillus segetis]GGH36611.1 ABC transporter permease [Paenibacillus segetis]
MKSCNWKPYILVMPALIGSLLFTIYPLIYALYLSLNDVDVINDKFEFIGLKNYSHLFQSDLFLQVVGNTLVYMLVTVVLTTSLSLVLAVMLNKSTWIHQFAQGAVFSPHIIPLVSVSMLWLWLMNKDAGLLNYILDLLGLPKLLWVESPSTSMLSLILVSVWKGLGFNILLIIAALQSIPTSVIEAARLDKAGKYTMFFKVTIPLISPTLFLIFIVNIIASFQVFDSVNVMTGGGPLNSTNVIAYWIYQTAFSYYRIGEASAGAIVLFVFVGLLTIVHFKLSQSRVHYQ